MERMQWIKEDRDIDRLYKADLALLYKHSPTCGVCRVALHEVEAFMKAHPDADVYAVDVLAQRDLSQQVAARTGITHESPQIIIFRDGSPLWSDSHYGVTAGGIAKQFESARR
jgi:bacillithiol system protein YtxJ